MTITGSGYASSWMMSNSPLAGLVEQVIDDLLDARSQVLDGARRERLADQAAAACDQRVRVSIVWALLMGPYCSCCSRIIWAKRVCARVRSEEKRLSVRTASMSS
jgi:hypothetical protein